MPVPYIPLPGLQNQPLNMATPSAAAMGAQAAGLGQVARGIAQIGGALGQHAEQVQGLENAYQESEVRQRISADMAELNQQLASNSDPASYMPLLEKSLAKQKTYLDDQNLSPVVREKLAFHFEEISSDARLRTGAAAAGMTAKRAQLAIGNEMDAARKYGDRVTFLDAGQRAVENNLMLPEQFEAQKIQFEEDQTFNSIVKSIEKDPIMVAEQLNDDKTITQLFPNLTPENHDRLKKYAEQQSNRAKSDSWDQIALSSMEGKVLSKEDILQMAKDGDISPAQAGSYINAYHGPTPPEFDPIIYDDAHKAIMAYDPTKDETKAVAAEMAAQIATLPLPAESIRELVKQFKAKQGGSSTDTTETNKDLHKEFNSRLENEWDNEAFGNWFDDEKVEFIGKDGKVEFASRKPISQKDFGTSLAFKLKTQRAFNSWLSQQPDGLDPMEAEKKYNEIKGKALDGVSMPDLTPTTAPLPTFDDVDELMTTPGVLPLLSPTSNTIESGTSGTKTGQSQNVPDPKTSRIGTFGGQPIQPPGTFYKGAATSVFGGNTDPADNGLSANGGSNNATAGVAIPEKILKATFPGKDKKWFFENVKIVVEADNGRKITVPLVDYGTAEWVTQREGRHKLDLNPKAVAALGGQVIYKNGVMKSHAGFKNVNFALTTAKAGKLDPKVSSLEDMKAEWFKDKRPRHPEQIRSGMAALYNEFFTNQFPQDA